MDMTPTNALTSALPDPCPPVRDRGSMVPGKGWQPENLAWADVLTVPDPYYSARRLGVDPMKLDPAVLTAAGHPRRSRASAVTGALREFSSWPGLRFSQLRDAYCVACAGDRAEARHCSCIECPIWPYRTGKNPHNPRRGRKPAFSVAEPPVTANLGVEYASADISLAEANAGGVLRR